MAPRGGTAEENIVVSSVHKKGNVIKRGFRFRKMWVSRKFVLKGATIAYYSLEELSKGNAAPRGVLKLSGSTVVLDCGDEEFYIFPRKDASEKEVWRCQCESVKEQREWVKAIRTQIEVITWFSRYAFGRSLGTGAVGTVKECVDLVTGSKYAVKIVDITSNRRKEVAEREVQILQDVARNIRHPGVIRIHKVFHDVKSVYMILQLLTGGELYDRIVSKKKFSEADAAKYVRQILSALQALHMKNILHMDIKPENIIFSDTSEDAHLVLTDFSLSKAKDAYLSGAGDRAEGTLGYTAPEIILSKLYRPAADVFSVGVVLFILLAGYPPFRGRTKREIAVKTVQGRVVFEQQHWRTISLGAKNLVQRMLMTDPQNRISVDEALRHPWLLEAAPHKNLPHTLKRLVRHNTERKTASVMLRLERDLDGNTPFGNVTRQQRLALRQLFIDTGDSNGRLNRDRFVRLHRAAGGVAAVEQLMFDFFDADADGLVSFEDHLNGVNNMLSLGESFLRTVFRIYAGLYRSDLTSTTASQTQAAANAAAAAANALEATSDSSHSSSSSSSSGRSRDKSSEHGRMGGGSEVGGGGSGHSTRGGHRRRISSSSNSHSRSHSRSHKGPDQPSQKEQEWELELEQSHRMSRDAAAAAKTSAAAEAAWGKKLARDRQQDGQKDRGGGGGGQHHLGEEELLSATTVLSVGQHAFEDEGDLRGVYVTEDTLRRALLDLKVVSKAEAVLTASNFMSRLGASAFITYPAFKGRASSVPELMEALQSRSQQSFGSYVDGPRRGGGAAQPLRALREEVLREEEEGGGEGEEEEDEQGEGDVVDTSSQGSSPSGGRQHKLKKKSVKVGEGSGGGRRKKKRDSVVTES